MKIGLALAGSALAALLVAPISGFAQDGSDTSSGTTSLVIIEQIDPAHQTILDMGDEGISQGDIIVFTGSLLDEEGTVTGKSSGFCITTDVEENLNECLWTYHLPDGSITIAGTEPELGADTEIHMPIVGGTGGYVGARGLIHEQHNEDLTVFTTTIEIINTSLLSHDPSAYWSSMIHWADLAEQDQAAWNVLGWNETNWESDDPTTIPVSETTAWSQLTQAEQAAARVLGYDEESWAGIQARMPENDVNEFWLAQQWGELKYSEKRLWGILGWNEMNWESTTDEPASEAKTWAELTTEEQTAAMQLGYTEDAWDAHLP